MKSLKRNLFFEKAMPVVLFSLLIMILASCSKDEIEDEPITLNPTLTTISPTSGPKTTIVTINGSDFDTNLSNISVFFNEKEAVVQSVTATKIVAVIPARAFTGLVKVISNGTEVIGPEFTYTISDIQVSTLAGSAQGYVDGIGNNAQFNNPWGISINATGTINVADYNNHKIREISPNAEVTTLAGSTAGFEDGISSSAKFKKPTSLVEDSSGNIFIVDRNNHKIRIINSSGLVATFAGSIAGFSDGTGDEAQFNLPNAIAIDSDNNLYVTDNENHRIRKITPGRVVTTVAGSIAGFEDGMGTNAKFDSPFGICIDVQNNLYVADSNNHSIRKIATNGNVTTLAGDGATGDDDGDGIDDAQFRKPKGITIDKDGNLYIADTFNNTIRKIKPNGFVSTIAGRSNNEGIVDGVGVNARFYNPWGIVCDNEYNLFIADTFNHRIRKITQE